VFGYSDSEIDEIGDISKLGPTDLQELIKRKSMASLGLNGNHQKVVPMAEVEEWVEQRGWDFVTSLPGDKAIIRLPS